MSTAPSIDKITTIVLNHYKVVMPYLLKRSRKRCYVLPRQAIAYLLQYYGLASHNEIARMFNLHDHTISIHYIRQVNNLMQTDPDYKREIQHLIQLADT